MDKEETKPLNRIKVVLAEKGKPNKFLSDNLGVAPTTVSKWVTNTCQPPMETFVKIAKLLDVELAELIRMWYNIRIAYYFYS